MSFLASVLSGRPGMPAKPETSSKFLSPTLDIDSKASDTLKFQQAAAEPASGLSLRYFLPLVLDSVNEVSYKINVPNLSNLPPLRLASKYILDLIKVDNMTPGDLYGPQNVAKSSGLDNYFFNFSSGLGSFLRFAHKSQVDLPDRFFEEYNLTQTLTKMGVFSEISRAWIIVDNKLVLWDYTRPPSVFNKSAQFLTLDTLKHSILAAHLTKPKKGVFVSDASYLLIVATTSEIHIYVVKHDPASGAIELFNPNLSVGVLGVIVNCICSNDATNDIYFCGEGDGVNVYRLDYFNSGSFIRNKCDKVCLTKQTFSMGPITKIPGFDLFTEEKHRQVAESIVQLQVDSSRNILYSLSNKSVIRTYKLAPNQELFLQHNRLPPADLFRALSQMLPDSSSIKPFLKFRIVSILAVSVKESANVLLIAITNYGNRIYLKVGASSYNFMSAGSYALKLQVVSIRFPPVKEEPEMNNELDNFTRIKQFVALMTGAQQNSELLKNTKYGKMISPGVFLAVKKTKSGDKLFVSSVNYGYLKHNNKLVEDAEFIPVSSSATANNSPSLIIHDVIQLTPSMNPTNTPAGFANVLASQYTKAPLEFAVLTNYGISFFQYRTSDQILSSLEDKVIKNFVEENGYEETCSTLLYLACSSSGPTNSMTRRKAQLLFSHAGNNARLLDTLKDSITGQEQSMIEQVVLSDRFYGTCLLISRLLRECWEQKVFEPMPLLKITPMGSVEVASIKDDNILIKGLTIDKLHVEYYIGSVMILLEFFNTNANDVPGLNAPSVSSDPTKLDNEVCNRAEHIAFTSIVRSLTSMKEALSFLMVLIEETQSTEANYREIFKFLSLTNQLNLLTLKFKDLLLPTLEVKNLIKDLLSSIVNKTILKGGSIDLMASSLQDRCGSFCSTDDVYIFKATEFLTRAKEIGSRDNEMKNKCLTNAVTLFEQASGSLTFENIENSINIMLPLDFYIGAVQFLLKLAKKAVAPQNALVSREQPDFLQGADSVQKNTNTPAVNAERRKQLYDLIFRILTKLDLEALRINELQNQLLINEFIELRDATYDTCFASDDRAFHFEFYQWFINQGCSERLLSVETPFILPFLEEKTDDLMLTELLWLYHAKREQYLQAAKILYGLAISDFAVDLRRRIEYLSRLNGFCNCTCPPNSRQEMAQLSTLIRELFDVANVQLDLLHAIETDSRIKPENKKAAVESLNNKIQNASELFNGYADPLGYYQICFNIFHISDYKNPDDIYKRWELFFESVEYDYKQSGVSQDWPSYLSKALVDLGLKLHSNEIVFPVEKLIKLIYKNVQNTAPGYIVDTFRRCGILNETLYLTLRSTIEHNLTHESLASFLKQNEMLHLIKEWYLSDKKLREAVPEGVASMTEYSLDRDPISDALRTFGSLS